jgi:hypothetical protein
MQAASLIEPGRTVLDLGCGPYMALQSFLPTGCQYTPADLTKWSDDVIVVDLDRGEFPAGSYDYVVILGVLEYLQTPAAVLREARLHAAHLIASFALLPEGGDLLKRQSYLWINHYRQPEFEAELAGNGWSITDRAVHSEQAHDRHMIFRAV